jgi:RHS repeat-associated protein
VRDSTPSAQDYAQQRYYSNITGRFFSPDPSGVRAADPKNPMSWNRYAYVQGDPVNHTDRKGLYEATPPDCVYDPDGCDDWGDCNSMFAFMEVASCSYGGDPGGPVATSPAPQIACWQQAGNISATLTNLGTDIENDVAGSFSAADMQLLTADIAQDMTSELASLVAGADAGSPPSTPDYRGGHFNLIIPVAQIRFLSAQDQITFNSDFTGGDVPTPGDGVRQAASTGLAASGGYTLHSQYGKAGPTDYSFHFDRFNRNSGLAGAIGHGIWDWAGGHIGHPCLDPAWH